MFLMWCNVGFTAINDVYYCEMDKIVKTTDGKNIDNANIKITKSFFIK